ncbi:telomere-protecting terminal protein Tpg [Streptomyces sp. NPDC013740]|uniref:telomere-protecting terminal protein Tpg n=1 Tax=Streptomyces sp. NPDC013740 TaxID=3364867 RepID=UPI0036FCAF84
MTKSVGEGLSNALEQAVTRPAPKSPGAQMRYLVKQLKGTKAAAQALGISQRTVERYIKNQLKKPRPDLAARLSSEVKKRWQPRVKAQAKKTAGTSNGLVIDVQGRLGYSAPIGTTDEARERHLTVALPPRFAERLFHAQEQGASENQLQQIAAEGLKETYFQNHGTRAGSLEEVRLSDIQHIEFGL